MDISKKRKFNAKMGKPKMIAGRKYFDTGGLSSNSTVGGTNTSGGANAASSGLNNNGIANAIGAGNSFNAGSANIQSGTNQQQLQNAYTGSNQAINAQIGLTNTLTPQAQTAVNNQNAVAAQELAMSQGAGPNPAMAQLAQTTGQNINAQAALMAGQRGASANVGELARQAAQTGAGVQQQAVGQAATQEANQQIAAQQNLASLAGNQIGQTAGQMGNLSQSQQNEQNILQNANTAYNNSAVGMQSNINNVNGQTAAANSSANRGLIGSVGAVLGGLAKGGEVRGDDNEHLMIAEMNAHSLNHRKKFAAGGPTNMGQQNFNQSSAGGGPQIEATPSFGSQDSSNPALDKAAGALGQMAAKKIAANKADADYSNQATAQVNNDVASVANDPLPAGGSSPMGPMVMRAHGGELFQYQYRGGQQIPGPHKSSIANLFAGGGSVKAMLSPGERSLNQEEVREVVEDGENPMKLGKIVGGKAKVKGDSLKNDVVPADLEEGGVIIDRKTEMKKNPRKDAAFVKKAIHMKSPKKGNK